MPDDPTPDVPPEIHAFLRERARALDSDTRPVELDDVVDRPVEPHAVRSRVRWAGGRMTAPGRRRGTPALAATALAAVLIAGVVGFAAGRQSAPKPTTVAASSARAGDAASGAGTPAELPGMPLDPSAPPLERLFTRTTTEGIVLRAYLQQWPAHDAAPMCADGGGSWCPPPECNPTSYLEAELSSPEAVAASGTPVFPLDAPAVSRGQIPFGQLEGSPVSAWMVQANDDIAKVVAEWPDGYIDEMEPGGGWAIVAHTGSTPPSSLSVQLRDSGTATLEPLQLAASDPAQCQPPPPAPPELPPAGDEQPADVQAATRAVTDTYNLVFDHSSDPPDRQQHIEDWDNLVPARDQATQNFPEPSQSVTVDVGEIRFLSPTDAALYFELKYDGGQLFGQQIGYARLIDGTWKVARDTMCMVFSWAGAQCDPPPDPARSHSSGSAPQPGTYSGPGQATATPTPTTN